jgi:hypothetical protein
LSREDAGAVAPAIEAILVFTAAHRGDTLVEDDGVEPFFGKPVGPFQQIADLLKDFVGRFGITSVHQQAGLKEKWVDLILIGHGV